MDTSEQYIKMADYPEIQGLRGKMRAIGDIWWFKGYGSLPSGVCYFHRGKGKLISGVWDDEDYLSESVAPSYFIWLPRQDQLQDMVKHAFISGLIKDFSEFALGVYWRPDGAGDSCSDIFTSMEQLWLAFVLHERFGKVWSGTEWVASC